jgi:hypothetical protein
MFKKHKFNYIHDIGIPIIFIVTLYILLSFFINNVNAYAVYKAKPLNLGSIKEKPIYNNSYIISKATLEEITNYKCANLAWAVQSGCEIMKRKILNIIGYPISQYTTAPKFNPFNEEFKVCYPEISLNKDRFVEFNLTKDSSKYKLIDSLGNELNFNKTFFPFANNSYMEYKVNSSFVININKNWFKQKFNLTLPSISYLRIYEK